MIPLIVSNHTDLAKHDSMNIEVGRDKTVTGTFPLGHPFSFYNRVVTIGLSKTNWALYQVSESPQTLDVIF